MQLKIELEQHFNFLEKNTEAGVLPPLGVNPPEERNERKSMKIENSVIPPTSRELMEAVHGHSLEVNRLPENKISPH